MTLPTTPRVTTDIIIELDDRARSPIVLIERKNPPYGWALPGGFVDVGEKVECAAWREAQEETGLNVRLTTLLGCYSDPVRDARMHTVSLVYIARAQGLPQAQDDAANLAIFLPSEWPDTLAFDHGQILRDYLVFRQRGVLPQPRPALK